MKDKSKDQRNPTNSITKEQLTRINKGMIKIKLKSAS